MAARGTGRRREARGLPGARVAARLPQLVAAAGAVERVGRRRGAWEPAIGAGRGDFFFFS